MMSHRPVEPGSSNPSKRKPEGPSYYWTRNPGDLNMEGRTGSRPMDLICEQSGERQVLAKGPT